MSTTVTKIGTSLDIHFYNTLMYTGNKSESKIKANEINDRKVISKFFVNSLKIINSIFFRKEYLINQKIKL